MKPCSSGLSFCQTKSPVGKMSYPNHKERINADRLTVAIFSGAIQKELSTMSDFIFQMCILGYYSSLLLLFRAKGIARINGIYCSVITWCTFTMIF